MWSSFYKPDLAGHKHANPGVLDDRASTRHAMKVGPERGGHVSMKAVIGVIAIVFLCGCASKLNTNIPEHYQLSAESGEGLIVASTRFEAQRCPPGSGAGAYFSIRRGEEARALDYLFLVGVLSTIDPADPARQFFIRKFPAGSYGLRQFSYVSGWTGTAVDLGINKPFTVVAGQAHYLGEIKVIAKSCVDFEVIVTNQRERDMKDFTKRVRTIPSYLVKNQVLTSGFAP